MNGLLVMMAVATSTAPAESESEAETEVPSLIGHAILGGTWNPRAGGAFLGIRHHNLYGTSDNPILNNLYVDYGAEVIFSASLRPALFVEWSPLAILKLKAQYEFWGWTGAHLGLGHGLTFPGPDAPFDEETLEAREGEEDPNIGHRFVFIPTLQLKVWRIIALNEFEIAAWYVHNGNAGEYWYDSIDDSLIKKGAFDGTIRNRLIVGVIPWDGDGYAQLVTAVVYDYNRVLGADIERHRLAGLIQFTPFHELWGLSKPTLIVLAGGNVRDRNRQGEVWLLGAIRLELAIL